jgi:nucleoside-diphosphate-sugar epimerase
MSAKTVLLTGASGFIGHHAIQPLVDRGYQVHAVSSQARAATPGVTWHQADLLSPGGAQPALDQVQPTHLLHLAWYVVPGKLISSPENLAWVDASMDLVRRFAAAGGKRVTICGSGYEYDWTYGYCSEQHTPASPNTIYGACKQALNLLVQSFAQESGLSAAWGRVFFLYGPHEHPNRLVSSVIRSLLAGQPAKCSHGRQVRDYMHVQDVAGGLVALLDSPAEGAFNVSSGQAVTLREMVTMIGRILGRPELIELGAIPARANDTPLVAGDNTRMVAATGWTPRFDLEEGLRHTIDWWRKEVSRAA